MESNYAKYIDLYEHRYFYQDGICYDIYNLPKNFVIKGSLQWGDPSRDVRWRPTHLPDLSTVTLLGHFICSFSSLTDLTGAPKYVEGDFDCSGGHLGSLRGAPKYVGGNFKCTEQTYTDYSGIHIVRSYKKMTNLLGAPEYVGGNFDCTGCYLKRLRGAPKYVGGNFDCSYNPNLENLLNAPKHVGGTFNFKDTNVTKLKGAPEYVGGDFIGGPNISSLRHLPKHIGGTARINTHMTANRFAPKHALNIKFSNISKEQIKMMVENSLQYRVKSLFSKILGHNK